MLSFSPYIRVRTGGDRREGITVSTGDLQSLDGSRGEAHFIVKWPGSISQAYIKILPVKNVDGTYKAAQSGKWVTVLGFECRGLEPTAWIAGIDFDAVSTGGTSFKEVDLSDKEWAEYDEENDLSVSITNLEYKIETSL